jgi:hypothetical protein
MYNYVVFYVVLDFLFFWNPNLLNSQLNFQKKGQRKYTAEIIGSARKFPVI